MLWRRIIISPTLFDKRVEIRKTALCDTVSGAAHRQRHLPRASCPATSRTQPGIDMGGCAANHGVNTGKVSLICELSDCILANLRGRGNFDQGRQLHRGVIKEARSTYSLAAPGVLWPLSGGRAEW